MSILFLHLYHPYNQALFSFHLLQIPPYSFFFQAEDGIRDGHVTGVQTCALPIFFTGDDVHKPAGVLSGGEKTRLALATLVVSSANVLLLDEPTNNLDPASREEILGALAAFEGAVVLVSHDPGAVTALSPERVLLMPDAVEDLWNSSYEELVQLA